MPEETLVESRKRLKRIDKRSTASAKALLNALDKATTVANKTALLSTVNATPKPKAGFYIVTSDADSSNAKTLNYWDGTALSLIGPLTNRALS